MKHAGTTLERRAHPRKRVGLALGLVLLAIFLTFGGYLAWANQPLPTELIPPGPLPQPNGYDAVAVVLAGLPPKTTSSPLRDPWKASHADLRTAIGPYRPALAGLRRALLLEYRTPPGPLSERSKKQMPLLRCAQALAVEARLSRADGDPAVAIDRGLDAVELASRMSHGSAGEWVLVPFIADYGLRTIDGESSPPTYPETIAAERRLDGIVSQFAPFPEVIENDRLLEQELIRVSLTDRSVHHLGEFVRGLAPMKWQLFRESVADFIYPKPFVYARMNAYLRRRNEARAHGLPPGSVARPRGWLSIDTVNDGAELLHRYTELTAKLRLVRLELALQAYQRRSGAFPGTLAQLDPALPPSTLVDPFSSAPFQYARRGKHYLLYSVGPDLRDDHGQPINYVHRGEEGDLVAGTMYR